MATTIKNPGPDMKLPFTQSGDRMSRPAYELLLSLLNRTGGTEGQDLSGLVKQLSIYIDQLEAEAGNLAKPVDNSAAIEELRQQISTAQQNFHHLAAAISQLSMQIADLPTSLPRPVWTDFSASSATFSGVVNFNGGTSTPLTFSQFFFSNQYGIGTPDSNGLQVFAADVGGGVRIGTRTVGLVFTQQALVNTSGLQVTAGFGCNTKTAQTAFASGGAAPVGGTGTAAGGWDTAAHRDSAITLLNNIRTALVNNGIMS